LCVLHCAFQVTFFSDLVWAQSDGGKLLDAAAEIDVTGGYSTEGVRAISAQARLFGEAKGGMRFYLEGTWTEVGSAESDAFGSAFPYHADVPRPMEMYAEKMFRPGGYVAGVRVGRYRTPFGIYGRGDHAYSGFLRAPLIRYEDYFALSNSFLEGGVDVVFGRPALNMETSLGIPQDPIDARRRTGLDWVVRGQVFRGPFIIGASYIRTRPARTRSFARGDTTFAGIDLRWMHEGVNVRGEWITGTPFDGTSTDGWYVDGIVHKPAMGPVTAVVRVERLDYTAGRFSFFPRRLTAGARVVLLRSLVAHVNAVQQTGLPESDHEHALDVALTYTLRLGSPQ